MTILERKIAPPSKIITDIHFPEVEQGILTNGIPIFMINAGIQDVVKLELIFESGQWFCGNPLLADFTSSMLIEGSKQYTSSEIAEKFDYYGTFTNFESGKHFSSIQLYCLSHFFEKSIEILQSFVKHPTFPEKELAIHLKNEYQQFILSREKTEVLAAEAFFMNIFGEKHPYGVQRKAKDYENLSAKQLKTHHQRYYNPANCKIVLSGKLKPEMVQLVEKYFGTNNWQSGIKAEIKNLNSIKKKVGKLEVHKKGAVQASIRIGKESINKKDPDFHGLSILNAVLGGYFGSRLMSSLREKNAMTYGIYSSLTPLLNTSVFSIAANVNSIQAEFAIEQILKEIELLKNDLIADFELEMVRNYLSGEMLRAFDGPLALSGIYSGLINSGLDFDYYRNYLKILQSINAKTLRDLANKYLNQDDLVKIIAGDFKK